MMRGFGLVKNSPLNLILQYIIYINIFSLILQSKIDANLMLNGKTRHFYSNITLHDVSFCMLGFMYVIFTFVKLGHREFRARDGLT